MKPNPELEGKPEQSSHAIPILSAALLATVIGFGYFGAYLNQKIEGGGHEGGIERISEYFGKNEKFEVLVNPESINKMLSKTNDEAIKSFISNVKYHSLIRTSSGKLYGYNPDNKMLYGSDAILLKSGDAPLPKLINIHQEMSRSGNLVIPTVHVNSTNGSTPVQAGTDRNGSKESSLPLKTESPEKEKLQVKTASNEPEDKLKELRAKLAERLENRKTSSTDSSKNNQSDEYSVAPDQMNIAALRETEEALFYKGQKIPKVGYDIDGKKLSSSRKREQVAAMVNKVSGLGEEWSVVYPASGKEKMKIAIFSDPTCPFCQKLHNYLPDLQEAGVTVYHLFYNRRLSPSSVNDPSILQVDNSLANAWCSDNPGKMVNNIYKGYAIPESTCSLERASFPGNEHYFMGRMVNMRGTPYAITDSGKVIAGFDLNAPQPLTFLKRIGL